MPKGSSTVEKALGLLDFFTERRPNIGLSEFARLSGYNKATTLRFLNSLEAKGFVEQDAETRIYHLGSAFLRFSRVRESSYPLSEAVKEILRDLGSKTGETAHASVIAGDALANIGQVESKRSNRVILEPGEALPFHATASGIVYLAFATPDIVERALSQALHVLTEHTPSDVREIEEKIRLARANGYCRVSGTYEENVVGYAAPYFGPSGNVCGAIAVAVPEVRATDALEATIIPDVRAAARRLTASRGGFYPQDFPE